MVTADRKKVALYQHQISNDEFERLADYHRCRRFESCRGHFSRSRPPSVGLTVTRLGVSSPRPPRST